MIQIYLKYICVILRLEAVHKELDEKKVSSHMISSALSVLKDVYELHKLAEEAGIIISMVIIVISILVIIKLII